MKLFVGNVQFRKLTVGQHVFVLQGFGENRLEGTGIVTDITSVHTASVKLQNLPVFEYGKKFDIAKPITGTPYTIATEMDFLDYAITDEVPVNYFCNKCGSVGVRLWRDPSLTRSAVLCAHCGEEEERTKQHGMQALRWKSSFKQHKDLYIGNLIPAIPLPDRPGYWADMNEIVRPWWMRLEKNEHPHPIKNWVTK